MLIFKGIGYVLYIDTALNRLSENYPFNSSIAFADYQLSAAIRWITRERICRRCNEEMSSVFLDAQTVCDPCGLAICDEVMNELLGKKRREV